MALGLLFLYKVRSALPPFLIALLIAVVVDPVIRRFEAGGWPRSRSVPLLFLLILMGMVAALVWGAPLLYNQVTDLIENAPYYIQQAQLQADRAMQTGPFQRLPDHIRALIGSQIEHLAERITGAIPDLLTRVTALFGATVSHFFWLLITLLATYYFMLDMPKLQIGIFRLIPLRHRSRVRVVSEEVAGVFSAYLRGLFIVCALYGLAVWAALLPFGIPNTLALGALAGVFYMVPYLGALVTTIIVGLVTFFSTTLVKTLGVLAAMLFLHQIFDYIVTPRVLGGQVGLHPLASLFAMVTGGTLFGITGIILAVPVAASLLIILRNLYPRLLRPLPEMNRHREEREEPGEEQSGDPAPGKIEIPPDGPIFSPSEPEF